MSHPSERWLSHRIWSPSTPAWRSSSGTSAAGQRMGRVGAGPRRHHRQPVGGPVVGDVGHVVLAVVALRRQVGADAQRRLVPALARELLVHQRQRPERPGRWRRGSSRRRRARRPGSRKASTEPRGSVCTRRNAGEAVHLVVEVVVARDLAPQAEAGEVERRRAGLERPGAVVEGGPVALVVEVLVGERDAPLAAGRGGVEAGPGRLPERADGAGVVDDVVAAEVLARRRRRTGRATSRRGAGCG